MLLCVCWILLGTWAVTTVGVQVVACLGRGRAAFDVLWLLPDWRLFAPNPRASDVRLLVRFRTGEVAGDWGELGITSKLDEDHPQLRWLFNPDRRVTKQMFDFSDLVRTSTVSLDQIRMNSDYLAVSEICIVVARDVGSHSVQFMLAESNWSMALFQVLLLSEFFQISPASMQGEDGFVG